MSKKFFCFKNFFTTYLIFLCFASIYLFSKFYLLHVNNSMAEWVINYHGGFGRRGFLGEILAKLSFLADIYLKDIILYFLYFLFLSYYVLVYLFFKSINFKPIFILAILSPLFLIFPLAELEALGRKDILIPICFLLFSYLFKKFEFKSLMVFLILIYTLLLLTHEVSIFYLPFFYLVVFFKLKKIKLSDFITIFLVSLYFLSIVFLLSNSIHTDSSIEKMCESLKNSYNTECGLGASVLNRKLMDNVRELGGLNITHIIRGLLIFLIGAFALITSIKNSEYCNRNYNFIFKRKTFAINFLIIFLPTLIPFIIAVDWGRWFNLSYTMSLLFYFFCFKNNLIFLGESNFIKFIDKVNKKKILFVFMIFIICFTWNPKAVHHEDIGSIPIYRVIAKIIKYY